MKKRTHFKTIKGTNGDLYLCPADDVTRPEELSDSELEKRCVNDSYRPTDR